MYRYFLNMSRVYVYLGDDRNGRLTTCGLSSIPNAYLCLSWLMVPGDGGSFYKWKRLSENESKNLL
jgi:hypothetical protein